ncbi:7513_t:CDS:2 [Paraglomus occultum]|uniref:7513_t:CDS:1 n=1 Tax=Paraglomus occultum TaxID=144539 RepID=A0A9N9EWT3_9GLOM|nr:7513_t:CDS:2 [Paraglomus occultum]
MAAPEELVPFSRIRLAQALKEDPKDPQLVHQSALFIQLRNRQPQALEQSQHNIPRPHTLIIPPSLGNGDGAQSKPHDQFRKSRIYSSPSLPSLPVSRHTPNHSPNGSVSSISSSPIPPAPPISQPQTKQQNALIGTVSIQTQRPTTLMDVRKSILDSRQIMTTFSPASSHRTSRLLHQKSYSDVKSQQPLSRSPLSNSNSSSTSLPSLANTSNQSSSRPNSIFNQSRPNASPNLPRPASSHSNMSRPLSTYSAGKGNSRPPSIWGYVPPVDSSEESSEESSEDEEESGDEQENVDDAKKTEKTTSRPSGLPLLPPLSQLRASKTPSPTSSPTRTSPTRTSPTRTSPTRSSTKSPESGDDDVKVSTPTSMSILEKVEEEKSDEESSESEEGSDDGSSEGSSEESEEESEDSGNESSDSDTPLALRMGDAPPRISVLSSSGKKSPRVEAWVSDVSRQSLVIDSRTFNPRKQRQSHVIGDARPRKSSLTPDSAFDPRMRRPRSAYAMDESDFLPPQPQYRKRSNSEFTPGNSSQYRPFSMYSAARASPPPLLSTPVQLPKADTDDWAQDTILALTSKVPSSASPVPPPSQKHKVVRSSISMTNIRAGTPPLSLPTPPRSPGEFYIHHSRKQSGSNSSLNKLVLNGESRRERGDRDRMERRERERSYSASSQQQGRRRDHAGLGYGPAGMSPTPVNRISMYGGAAHRRVASDHVSKGDNMMHYSQHTQYRHRKDLQT